VSVCQKENEPEGQGIPYGKDEKKLPAMPRDESSEKREILCRGRRTILIAVAG
jgi:hypothetical protein